MNQLQKAFKLLSISPTIALLAIMFAACSQAARTAQLGINTIRGELEFEGHQRSYVLLVPVAMNSSQGYPMVLALHGGGGDGERMCSLRGGIQELAAQENFIVVCPSGVERHWNDGREIERWRAHAEDIDDVGFLLDLIDSVIKEYPVDQERIYVTGMSNGGKMSLRLACEASAMFQAAAPVIATLPTGLECNPAESISILMINGTADPLVPWDGGVVQVFNRSLGEVQSTKDTIAFWVKHNQCEQTPKSSVLPDKEPSDGSWIEMERYNACRDEVVVQLYTVQGGGHTWPGGSQYLPEVLIGSTNKDAHAGKLIWQFFKQVSFR